ncbi:hypothetical protein DL96DRAFT_1590356 [Flagelloscypha sp. PMI_526]|nr:hypothetical protein DL96DRAFT_1590356 [Flagelloscypha sp. PMI_526]
MRFSLVVLLTAWAAAGALPLASVKRDDDGDVIWVKRDDDGDVILPGALTGRDPKQLLRRFIDGNAGLSRY